MIFSSRPSAQTASGRLIALTLSVAMLLSATGCARFPLPEWIRPVPTDAPESAQCLPDFSDQDGWLGGDAAFSVALDSRRELGAQDAGQDAADSGARSLWFFGDSFVARNLDQKLTSEAPPTRTFPFIHNAVGESFCDHEGNWRIQYHWQKTAPPHAFFEPDSDAPWVKRVTANPEETPYYWPLAPFLVEGTLYVGLLRVLPAPPQGPFNLPFRLIGADLARIENPMDPPPDWRIEIRPLTEDARGIPGSAWVVQGDFAYAFGYLNGPEGDTPRILSRIPLDTLRRWPEDFATALQTLQRDGTWKTSEGFAAPRVVMEDDATEMSLHFSPRDMAWFAVYSDPTPATADAQKGVIWIRHAKELEGPWSAPRPLAIVPERRRDSPWAHDPNLFCYAGKAHPQFSRANEVLVTYVCNFFARNQKEIPGTLKRLLESPGIYRPRAIRIKIPPLDDP